MWSIVSAATVAHLDHQHDQLLILYHTKDPKIIDPITPKLTQVTLEGFAKLAGGVSALDAIF